jgi:hypothetical protein
VIGKRAEDDPICRRRKALSAGKVRRCIRTISSKDQVMVEHWKMKQRLNTERRQWL